MRRAFSWCALGWLAALFASACHEPAHDPPATNAPVSSSSASVSASPCDALFQPPPNATLLCDQHDLATNAEVSWRSYGVTDSRAAVNDYYRDLTTKCNDQAQVGIVTKPPLFSITKGSSRLETFEASEKSFPHCEVAPKPEHKTVVLTSLMFKR